MSDSKLKVKKSRCGRRVALLKKEQGVWVYQGEPVRASLPDVIDQERTKRLRELMGSTNSSKHQRW